MKRSCILSGLLALSILTLQVSAVLRFQRCENVPTTNDLKRVTWHNGIFYAVGQGSTILRSTDGLVWTKDNMDLPDLNIWGIAGNAQDVYACGGSFGTISYNLSMNDWLSLQYSTSQLQQFFALVSTGRSNSAFLAAGSYGAIYRSGLLPEFQPCTVKTMIPFLYAAQFFGLAVNGNSNRGMAVGTNGLAAIA